MRIYFDGPYIILAGVILIVALVFMIYKLKTNSYFTIFFALFYIYICLLIKYTQFPIVYIPEFVESHSIISRINFIPFNKMTHAPMNAFLNVVLTMPFGFLLPFVKRINSKKTIVIWAIVLPLLLEGLQLTIGMLTGYTERIIDINDVIFNFIGVIFGFSIFKGFVSLLNNFSSEKEWTKSSFFHFIKQR